MDFLFGDEESVQLDEHQIAWYSKDYDEIKRLADSYKETKENELFSILNDLNVTKRPRSIATTESYSKYAIDSYFSGSADTIYQAYVANLFLSGLSDQAHYNYMLAAIPRGKRFIKKTKGDEDLVYQFKIKLLKKIYTVSTEKAHEYYVLLKKKGLLYQLLIQYKAYVTEDFLKEITKSVKEQKELKELL